MINLKKFDLIIKELLVNFTEEKKPISEKIFKRKMKIDIAKIKEAILLSEKNENDKI